MKVLLTILFSISGLCLFGQCYKLNFIYDAATNQTERKLEFHPNCRVADPPIIEVEKPISEDISNVANLQLYPNPTEDILYIALSSELSNGFQIRIINSSGSGR